MYFKKKYSDLEAKKNLERYCAYQERCLQEVIKKLQSMHMTPNTINIIVEHLVTHNFLNEERFAKSFARGKFNIKKWGKNRIVNELKQRNISELTIQNALKEIDEESYNTTFHNLAEKKAAQLTDTTLAIKKRKLTTYLLYRGWEPHKVYEKVNDLF